MMRSVTLMALFPFCTRSTRNDLELSTNHFEGPVETTVDQKINELVDHFAIKLSDEALSMWSFHKANLESTTLGKARNLPSPLAFRPPCPAVLSQPARFFTSQAPSLLSNRRHREWPPLRLRHHCAYTNELGALGINDIGNRYPAVAHQLEGEDAAAQTKAKAFLRIASVVAWRCNKVLDKCKHAAKNVFEAFGPVAKRALETPLGKAVQLVLFCVFCVR